MGQVAAQESDADVLALATRAQAVLVTFDSDFGRLIFFEKRPAPLGLVYLQARPNGAKETIERLLAVLDDGSIDLTGRFIVIDQSGGFRVLSLY